MSSQQQVFISYAREDIETARKLYKDLINAGITCWFDEENLLGGQNWRLTISQEIKKSSYFLALISSNSVSKDGFVQAELKQALDVLNELPESGIFIIPVRIDDCEPDNPKLKNIHYIDLFPSYEKGLKKIMQVIKSKKENTKYSNSTIKEENYQDILPGHQVDKLYGRDEEYKFLKDFIYGNQRICFVHGIGGTGKTELVLYFANRLAKQKQRKVKLIVFISASPKLIEGEIPEEFIVKNREQLYRCLAYAIGKPYLTKLEIGEQHIQIDRELRRIGLTLLIVDNWETVEDTKLLGSLKQFSNNVKIIITTRVLPTTTYPVLTINPLKHESAIEFTKNSLSKKFATINHNRINPILNELVELCGRIPLAMKLAFYHINNSESINDLKKSINDLKKELHHIPISKSKETLCSIISGFSCKHLKNTYPNLYYILQVLTLLPRPVPRDDLEGIIRNITTEKILFIELDKYQLIVKDLHGYSLHTIVREYVIKELSQNKDKLTLLMNAIISFYLLITDKLVGDPRIVKDKQPDYKSLETRAENIFHIIRWCYSNDRYEDLLSLTGNIGYLFRVSNYWSEGEELWYLASQVAKSFKDVPHQETGFRFFMYVLYLKIFRGNISTIELSKIDELFNCFFNLLNISDSFQLSYNCASFLRLMGLYNKEKRQFSTAYRFMIQSLEIMIKINNPHGICRIRNDMADLLLICDKEKSYFLLSENIKLIQKCSDFIEEIRTIRLLGDYYREIKEYETAKYYYKKTLDLLNEFELPDEKFCVCYGISKLPNEYRGNLQISVNHEKHEFKNLITWLENRPMFFSPKILRCIILDWSGVLADDLYITEKCQLQVLREFGVNLSSEEWRKKVSMNWKQFFRNQISDEYQFQNAIKRYENLILENSEKVKFLPYSQDVIMTLKKEGFIIVIYSSQFLSMIKSCLKYHGSEKIVDMIIIANDDVETSKPDRLHFESIMKKFNLKVSEMIVIDDMDDTIKLAKELGITSIGCKSMLNRDLSIADYQINHIGELREILNKLETVQKWI